jgi:hypothetical protein
MRINLRSALAGAIRNSPCTGNGIGAGYVKDDLRELPFFGITPLGVLNYWGDRRKISPSMSEWCLEETFLQPVMLVGID